MIKQELNVCVLDTLGDIVLPLANARAYTVVEPGGLEGDDKLNEPLAVVATLNVDELVKEGDKLTSISAVNKSLFVTLKLMVIVPLSSTQDNVPIVGARVVFINPDDNAPNVAKILFILRFQ